MTLKLVAPNFDSALINGIKVFSQSEEGLSKMLKTIEKYCKENELTLNIDKTKCMIFNKNPFLL